jgi:hypothetical protein
MELVFSEYGVDVNSVRGVSSSPLSMDIPNQYGSLKDKLSGVTLPSITLNIPPVTVTVCVSVQRLVLFVHRIS